MPSASGSIMAAVAVLLIHMDKKAVAANKSKMAIFMLPPDMESSHMAIFLSSLCICSAVARAKPPKKI